MHLARHHLLWFPLSFSLSDCQRGSKKNVLRQLPRSHSNFLLSWLSGEQPNAGLQKAAAARNTACIIEFAAVTYVNLSYLALGEEAFVLVKSVEPETRKKADGISAAATASLEDNWG